MVFDVEYNVANFRKLGVEGLKLSTTPSGHPALTIQCAGSSEIDPATVPKAWGDKEIEVLKIRGAYTAYVVGHGEAVVQGLNPGGDLEDDKQARVGHPILFYAKKISPAIYEALVADSLNMNTFLGWWNSTAISNDFWIETEHKLIRVHVTPRKSFFCADKWQTAKTLHRDRLLAALGDVRESWGIACTTQRELTTVIDRWRECPSSGYSTLWIGRSVFNRAVRHPRDTAPRHELADGAMEDEQSGTPTGVHAAGHPLPPEVDGSGVAPPSDGEQRDRADVPQALDLDEPGGTEVRGRARRDRVWTEGDQGEHHATDSGCTESRSDPHDGRAPHRSSLHRRAGDLRGLGIGGGEAQWSP